MPADRLLFDLRVPGSPKSSRENPRAAGDPLPVLRAGLGEFPAGAAGVEGEGYVARAVGLDRDDPKGAVSGAVPALDGGASG